MLLYLMLLDTEEKSFFEKLYEEYRQEMYKFAYWLLADSQAAEDVVHTVFVRVIMHIETVESMEAEKRRSYLMTAVRHAALDMKKKQKRHAQLGIDEVPQKLLAKEELAYWEKEFVLSILKLPVIYREVLQYKYAIGLENKEIGEILKISEATVRKRLERGKKLLREQWE